MIKMINVNENFQTREIHMYPSEKIENETRKKNRVHWSNIRKEKKRMPKSDNDSTKVNRSQIQ